MFRHLLAIVRFSSRELTVLLYTYIVRARDGEISTSGLYCVICNFYIGMRWCVLARCTI